LNVEREDVCRGKQIPLGEFAAEIPKQDDGCREGRLVSPTMSGSEKK